VSWVTTLVLRPAARLPIQKSGSRIFTPFPEAMPQARGVERPLRRRLGERERPLEILHEPLGTPRVPGEVFDDDPGRHEEEVVRELVEEPTGSRVRILERDEEAGVEHGHVVTRP